MLPSWISKIILRTWLSPWLVEPRGSMQYSKGLSNNPHSESNQPNPSYWYIFLLRSIPILSQLRLGLPKSLFPVGLSVNILKAFLPSLILATWSAHFNLLDLISLAMKVASTIYEVPHCEAFPTPHYHPSWAEICASGSCFQIPLVCIPPLM